MARRSERFGAVPSAEMERGFAEFIAHAAHTRPLCAGALVGSGTVSHSCYRQVPLFGVLDRRVVSIPR